MAPPRLLLLVGLCALLVVSSRALSEPVKDKKMSKQMSPIGPSYMKRAPFLVRPHRPLALLLLS